MIAFIAATRVSNFAQSNGGSFVHGFALLTGVLLVLGSWSVVCGS
jgi:hypothetical protein